MSHKGTNMLTRRQLLSRGALMGSAAAFGGMFGPIRLGAAPQAASVPLSDPALQPKFMELAPNALDPGFLYKDHGGSGRAAKKAYFKVSVSSAVQETGLVDANGIRLPTTIWGYGEKTISWPGQTMQVMNVASGGAPTTEVKWSNNLNGVAHLLPVDTNLHWCYSLPGYQNYSIAATGVPIIPHLHGGHTDYQFDGNPEFFFSPNYRVVGPQWANVPGGFDKKFIYDNNVQAGNLWYHDHALGITRLNVYAGLAGFYFVRDQFDTGLPGNPLTLPAFPYELAYAIQDRMFTDAGELFYPAMPGDPAYADFITGEGAVLDPLLFPGGGPTALAEFFGDHMVVNGKIWPKTDVEPRNYRMRLLNGCDSRFMILQFVEIPAGTSALTGTEPALPFTVIGSDQGLAASATVTDMLVFEPGSRYDIVFDFKSVTPGSRVVMRNIGGDEPFGGDIPAPTDPRTFADMDKVMAFDVVLPLDVAVPDDFNPALIANPSTVPLLASRIRRVALFEGKDEFGRLQPLLGTAEPATDFAGNPINWPADPKYSGVGLTGQMNGAIAWHSPTTENPALNSTEQWEIYNATGDAHPVHLHLVHFDVLARYAIIWDSATNPDDRVLDPTGVAAPAPNGDGTYLVTQPTVQHNSVAGDPTTYGMGFRLENLTYDPTALPDRTGYVENTPKDMVTALPGEVTVIQMNFDKPGRYVWHCHILSHEDHEMMRVLHVGP